MVVPEGLLFHSPKTNPAFSYLQKSKMGKLIIRELALALLISIGLANPLQVDLDIHLDDGDTVGIDENSRATFIPKVADLPSVDLPYERHKASPPIRVSTEKFITYWLNH